MQHKDFKSKTLWWIGITFTNQKTLMQWVNLLLQNSKWSFTSLLSLLIFGFPLSNKFSFTINISLYYQIPFVKSKIFQKYFFPYCINEWKNLTAEIRNSKSVNILKKLITCEKRKTHYFHSMIHSVLNSLPAQDFNLVIWRDINVDMVLEIK